MPGEGADAKHNGYIWSRSPTLHGKRFVKGVLSSTHIVGAAICRPPSQHDVRGRLIAVPATFHYAYFLDTNARAHLPRRIVVSKCALVLVKLSSL